MKTPEARFAIAVDRFQPMLLNCRTEGATWQRHGVMLKDEGLAVLHRFKGEDCVRKFVSESAFLVASDSPSG